MGRRSRVGGFSVPISDRSTFFGRHALLLLLIVFFFAPFALRGARVALQNMKNDVKDWLPSDFPETAELQWFGRRFLGEHFIVISWEGCGLEHEDERVRLFLAKLRPEVPPSPASEAGETAAGAAGTEAVPGRAAGASRAADKVAAAGDDAEATAAIEHLDRPDFVGDRLGLFTVANEHLNWGGRGEKWLKGNDGSGARWYFITPEGDLFRWDGTDGIVAATWRAVRRLWGPLNVTGELVHSFGPEVGPWYYERPRRLRAQLFKTVTTGPAILASLTGPKGVLANEPEEAVRRLSGTLFGPDGKQTCIIVTLAEVAKFDLHQVVGRGMLGRPRGRLYEIAEEVNLSQQELRVGGPPCDNVAIDEEGTITLVRLVGFSIALGLTLSLICFRSLTLTMIAFFVGGSSAVLSVSLVYWGGSSVDAVMMSMPSLVYVLGLSGAAHIINYYRAAVAEHGIVGAPGRALHHGWKPAVLCNVTTAIGLASLATSDLTPIRNFGIFSALGVMATLLILFTYLPASLQMFPQAPKPPRREQPEGSARADGFLDRLWLHLGSFCVRRYVWVSLGCVLVIVSVGWGVSRIQTSVNMLKLFHPSAQIIQNYEWLETHIGHLMPMELVVQLNPDVMLPPTSELKDQRESDPAQRYQLNFLERLELADRVQRVIEHEFGDSGQKLVGHGMSAATFGPRLPAPRGDTGTFARRGATNRQLEARRADFLASDYLRVDPETSAELWRVSLRVAATKGVDYGGFVADIKSAVEPVLDAYDCREQILRALLADNADASPAGAKVLLLGLRSAALADNLQDGSPIAVPDDDTSAPELGDREVMPVNGKKIFSRTLYDLLHVSRLRVGRHLVGSPWPEKWKELVASYDCVVLLDETGYDVAALRGAAKLLIDARQHRRDQSGTETAGIAGSKEFQALRFSAVYTGIVPIVYKAQRELLNSLIDSTFWSFVTITPLLILIARNILGGLVAMLPNVLPVLVVFGAMGWIGINVDVGSMMTASVALGVAVDDTIHYLNWFREELDRCGDRKEAIVATYRHCATPTLQAAVISGLGLSIFALSTFTPTQRFGFLMLAILWAGVIAELVFFPALLASPLGAVFKPRKRARQQQGDDNRHMHVNVRGEAGAPSAALAPSNQTSYSEQEV